MRIRTRDYTVLSKTLFKEIAKELQGCTKAAKGQSDTGLTP